MADFVVALCAFAAGGYLGIWSEARRWRGNASRIQRIESGGKLYKVTEAA